MENYIGNNTKKMFGSSVDSIGMMLRLPQMKKTKSMAVLKRRMKMVSIKHIMFYFYIASSHLESGLILLNHIKIVSKTCFN